MKMNLIPLLLTDPSACLRSLVLKDLMNRSPEHDEEIKELKKLRYEDNLIKRLIPFQQKNGAFESMASRFHRSKIIITAQALTRMGYLGFDSNFPPVEKALQYLLSKQNKDGSWPLSYSRDENEAKEGYSMIPLQTAIPLLGFVMCGETALPETDKAFEWLLNRSLPDGAWPTGIASGNYGRVAGYRKLAHSRWGCRSNTTAVLRCLARHPELKKSPSAQKALDLLLGRESKEKHTLGFETARIIGLEPYRGFLTYHARFDPALIIKLCALIGVDKNDQRLADMLKFIKENQGPFGLWEYPANPNASRWLTFDLLRSLSNIDDSSDWISLEPRTPFQSYPKRPKRY